MADPETPAAPVPPALQPLQDEVTRAKLLKELAEHQAGRVKALLPDLSGVAVAPSAVTEDEAGTGLTDVFVARAAIPLVDDLADLALVALRKELQLDRPVHVLVAGTTDVVGDCLSHRVLDTRLQVVQRRVHALLPPPTPDRALGVLPLLALPAVLAGIAQALPAALGLATRLLARSYATSSATVTALDRVAVDAGVAARIRRKSTGVTVELARVSPATASPLFGRLGDLADEVSGPLAAALREAGAVLAESTEVAGQAQARLEAARTRVSALVEALTVEDGPSPAPLLTALDHERQQEAALQRVLDRRTADAALLPQDAEARAAAATAITDATARLEAVRARLLELVKQLGPVDDDGGVTPRREALDRELAVERDLAAQLPALRRTVAEDQGAYDALSSVVEDATQLLGDVLTPGVQSAEPPLLGALRVDRLMDPQQQGFLVVVRPLSGGVDAVTEQKAGTDRRVVLAGIAVEWMVLDREGRLLDGGTRTCMRSLQAPLTKPDEMVEKSVLYLDVPDVRLDLRLPDPAQASSSG